MSWTVSEIRSLRVGGYIVVDEEPCKILSISTSKPGKHGEAKARLDVMGIFDQRKRSIVHPVTHGAKVPMIDKRKGQVISIQGGHAQIMDLETYQTFEMLIDDEWKDQLKAGQDCMYMSAMGKMKLTQLSGGD
ncbi:MAG TPA: translation initiation factor IF-5A [Candidatus Thermoplasmatota archaeon]